MRLLLRISAILSAMLTLGAICSSQTDPKNVPQAPTAELRKFDPFLGKYRVTGDFANLPWTGTLELKKVIKGWYIEQTILVKTEGIDREFRILATWDNNLQKYRLWGFQTLPTMPDNGGEIRFEGDEMITEWVSVRPDGSKATSSNRYRFVSKDELEILSYRQVENGPTEKIGFLKGKRTPSAEEVSAGAPDRPPANLPQPAPEMQSLAKAFEGRWSITEKYEPDEWTPNGGAGYGEEVWRSGPGGFTFMEEVHDHTPAGESFGLGLAWWDKAKGFQGIWCINTNASGCDLNAGSNFKWDGKQQVIDNEFQRKGKTFRWHEVLTDITPRSFVQTADIGAKGGPLKRWLTIHATKIDGDGQNSEKEEKPTVPTPAFYGLWTLNVEKSDFGDRAKPKTGFVNWGEHGWTFAVVQADGRIYADAVETSHGCTFIGMAPNDLSCAVEVVTPRHVRLTVKQGGTIRRIGDIELLEDGTTQTIHHVTPSQGAPYVEKTIWEKQVRE